MEKIPKGSSLDGGIVVKLGVLCSSRKLVINIVFLHLAICEGG